MSAADADDLKAQGCTKAEASQMIAELKAIRGRASPAWFADVVLVAHLRDMVEAGASASDVAEMAAVGLCVK